MKNPSRLSAWTLAFAAAWPAAFPVLAQTAPSLRETVVTATRSEQALVDTLADVSLIDRSMLERSGAEGLADVLGRLPGVEFARNGGPGSTTGMFLRGAESRFTAVFVDGVRIDSQATGGAMWESIPLAQVDHIEVLRGPAAAVFGSDAIAGVVQIFTKRGDGPFSPSLGIGWGRYGTRKLEAAASGSQGAFDYSVGLADVKSAGFNSSTRAGQNPDRDGMSSQSGNLRLGFKFNQQHSLEATALANHLNSQYDSSTVFADERNLYKLQTLGLHWKAQWSARLASRLSVTESINRYESTPSPYLAQTRLRGYTLFNEFKLGSGTVTATLERKEDWLDNDPLHQGRSQNALALGYGMRTGAHSLQVNLRNDRDSEFGGKATGSLAYGYALSSQWRATASVGNAYRAPTLYQRFSRYGKASLQPESSTNAEIGLRWAQDNSQVQWVAYRNRVTNQITFVSAPGPCPAGSGAFPGCYDNTAKASYTGMTLSGETRFAGHALRGSVDWQNPMDLTLDKQLARRARQHAQVGVDKRLGAWLLGTDVQWVGKRYSSPGEQLPMGGYGLLNLNASSRVAREWNLLARIDNLGNKRYETVSGYAVPGRSLYLGLQWAPR